MTNVPRPGNRFADACLGYVPVPLPRDYVQGIDRQRTDFELGERSYLCGRWQERGWWYYHLFGSAIKTPLGTLALLGLTICVTIGRVGRGVGAALDRSHHARCDTYAAEATVRVDGAIPRSPLADEIFLLAPAAAIVLLVSSQTGFSNHVRYTIPALPFLFIWCGKCLSVAQYVGWPSQAVRAGRRPGKAVLRGLLRHPFICRGLWFRSACWTCVAASSLASLSVYPHSLSYFNLLVGGPKNGHHYLLESNIACGQDLLYLKHWCERNPQPRPLRVASFGWIDPELAGIEYVLPPVGPSHPHVDLKQTLADVSPLDELGPLPGWYAIDVNFLHGTHWPAMFGGWRSQNIASDGPNFEYFKCFEPCDRAAYSFLIYHITLDDANRVRRELGLPEVAETVESN